MVWTDVLRAPDGEQPLGRLDGSWVRMGVEQVIVAEQARRKTQPPVVCNWPKGTHGAVAGHLAILTSLLCGEGALEISHAYPSTRSLHSTRQLNERVKRHP